MFWKKSPATAQPAAAARAPVNGEDAALDALASLLKAFGENAFDTDNVAAAETRAECEGWAKRITVGDGKTEQDEEGKAKPFKRDFVGVRRFFTAQRSHEREF